MYVIFPAEEVVFFTYGAAHTLLPVLRPRPTLDNLSGPAVLSPSSTTAARAPPPPSPSPTPSILGAALSKPPLKAKLLKKLGKAEDESFGRTARSPGALDFEQPAPLPTPAFSRRNIFERDFDALFESSHAPLFGENVRVATPTPESESHSADVTRDVFPAFPAYLAPPVPKYTPPASLPAQRDRPFSAPPYDSFQETPRKEKKVSFFRKLSLGRQRTPEPKMASAGSESALRELAHPAYNEALKTHNNVAFKLVKTVSDFSTQLAQVYEQHSSQLQLLVSSFRKKNAELRKERVNCPSSMFHTWETLLQEAEADSAGAAAAAGALDRQVARPLLERTFHLKLHARKLFAHRDGCDTVVAKADEKLSKSRAEYRNACATYATTPSPAALATYYDAHNAYVQQLTATNGMLEQYHVHTLPTILQELEDVYGDVCSILANAVYEGCGIITTKSVEQHRRYESLGCQARAVCAAADLAHAARAITTAPGAPPPGTRAPRRSFLPPHEAHADNEHEMTNLENLPPILRNEIVMDRLGPQQLRISYETLKKDCVDLEAQIKQLQDSLDLLSRAQVRSLEGNQFNTVNEIQDEISMKKYDYRSAQLHLAAVRAQHYGLDFVEDASELSCPQHLHDMSPASNKNNVVVNSVNNKRLSVVLTDIFASNKIKMFFNGDLNSRKELKSGGYVSDDESFRYKLNKKLLRELTAKKAHLEKGNDVAPMKAKAQTTNGKARRRSMDDGVRYKFPESMPDKKEQKNKPTKAKLKVNFWSSSSKNKLKFLDPLNRKKDQKKTQPSISPMDTSSRITKMNSSERIDKTPHKVNKNQVTNTSEVTPKKPIKKESFLPSPLFSDQHALMVTVPDDITLNFNAGGSDYMTQTMDKVVKKTVTRKRTSTGDLESTPNQSNPYCINCINGDLEKCYDDELEYFSKYVVQKLRKMDTNQRIYGENLINTVIGLGQLGQLNRKTKVHNAW